MPSFEIGAYTIYNGNESNEEFTPNYLGMTFAIFLGIHDAPLHGYLSEVGPKAEAGQNVDVGVVAVGVVLGEPLGDENGQPLESRPKMCAKMYITLSRVNVN